jgi:7-keto-8-aminopelargonate synthetase-like enzyme
MKAPDDPVGLEALPDLPRDQVLSIIADGVCLICGRGGFKAVGAHMCVAHGLTSAAVREHYGFARTQSLATPDLNQLLSALQRQYLDEHPQRRAQLIARMRECEGQPRAPMRPQTREAISRANDEGARVERVCPGCGKLFHAYMRGQARRYCSFACYRPALAEMGLENIKAIARRQKTDPEFAELIAESRARALANNQTPEVIEKRRQTVLRRYVEKLGPAEHGTMRMYKRGCRCEACRAENTRLHRAYLDKHKPTDRSDDEQV